MGTSRCELDSDARSVGRPAVVDKVDGELVVRMRNQCASWNQIAEAHPPVKSASGRVRPSVGSIRRAFGFDSWEHHDLLSIFEEEGNDPLTQEIPS